MKGDLILTEEETAGKTMILLTEHNTLRTIYSPLGFYESDGESTLHAVLLDEYGALLQESYPGVGFLIMGRAHAEGLFNQLCKTQD